MENNQLKDLDEKAFIKNALLNIVIWAFFVFLSPVFLKYGRDSFVVFCIALGACVAWGLVTTKSMSLENLSHQKINKLSKILQKALLVCGILMVIINLLLIFIEGGKINYYHSIIVGLIFVYYPSNILKKIKQLEMANAFVPRSAPGFVNNKQKRLRFILLVILVFIFGAVFYLTRNDVSLNLSNYKDVGHSEITENVYRNLTYNFQIEFPKGWEIDSGDRVDTIQKATFEHSEIRIMLKELDIKESLNFSSAQSRLNQSLEAIIDNFNSVDGIEVIDHGETVINNMPSVWIEFKGVDATEPNTVLQHLFLRENILYSVSAVTTSKEYPKLKPLFMQVISTFIFENN